MAQALAVAFKLTADGSSLVNTLQDSKEKLEQLDNALSQARAEALGARNAFKHFGKTLSKNLASAFESAINQAGQLFFSFQNIANAVQAFASPFKKVVSVGALYEAQMDRVAAISGATDSELQQLIETTRLLGSTTQFSASEVGKAAEYLSLAGFSANKQIAALPGLLSLSAAAGEDLATVADIVSDQLTALGMSADQTGVLSDAMAKAMSSANTTVGMLGDSMKYSSPVFTTAGQSMQTLITATSLLANAGIKGSSSGTALRMSMLRLAAPPRLAAKEIDKLGIKVSDSKGNFKDFSEILKDFAHATKDMTAADKLGSIKTIVGVEASSAFLELIKQSQAATDEFGNKLPTAFEKFRKTIEKSEGTAAKMAEKMTDNLVGSWKTLGSSVEELWITLFDEIKEPLNGLVKSGIEFVRWFTSIWPQISSAITTLLSPLQMVSSAFQSLGTWIGQAAASFSLLTEGLSFTEKLQYALLSANEYIQNIDWSGAGRALLTTFVEGFMSVGTAIYDAVFSTFEYVASLLPHSNADMGPFARLHESGVAFIGTIIDGIVSTGSKFFETVVEIFEPVLPYLESFLKAVSASRFAQMILPHFQKIGVAILGGITQYGGLALTSITIAITTLTQAFNIFRTSAFAAASIHFLGFLIKNIPVVISFGARLISIVTGLVAALGGLANIGMLVITAFSKFTMMGKAMLGIASVGALIYANWDGVSELATDILSTWQNVDESLKTVFLSIVVGIGLVSLALMGSPILALFTVIGFAANQMGVDFAAVIDGIVSLFGSFKDYVDFFMEPFDAIKVGVLAMVVVVGTAIGALIIKLRRSMQLQTFAKECKQNPLMKCMLPSENDKKRWNAFKKDLKEGQRGFALMNNKTDCGALGNCLTSTANAYQQAEKNITKQSRLIENSSRSAASSSKKTWVNWAKNVGSSISNAFKSLWNVIAEQAKKSMSRVQSFVNEAKWTGSGQTDMRRGETLDRTSQMAKERGVNRYQGKTFKESDAFKQLKQEAQAQAKAQRTFMQGMVADFTGTMKSMASRATDALKQTGSSMKGMWQQMKSQSDNTFNSLKQKANEYKQFAQKSNQFSSGSSETSSTMSRSGLNQAANQAMQRQQELMKQLGTTASQTASQTGAAFNDMGQRATGYTSKLTKVGLAAAAIGGITLAFSGTANAASELEQVQQQASLLEQASRKLSEAWDWLGQNMETVGMGAMMVLGSGLIELTTVLSLLAKTTGLAAAAFIGWKIGEFLYQFESVQEFAIGTIEVLMNFADAVQNAFNKIMDAVKNGNFAEAGSLIISGLIEGIQSVGNLLLDAVGGMLKMAASAILPDSWVGPATGLIDGFIGAIKASANFIIDVVQIGIEAVGTYLSSVSWSELGNDLLQGFLAIFSGGPIIAAIKGMMAGARDYLTGLNWNTEGQSLLQTLGYGIKAAIGLLIAAFKGAIDGVKNYIFSIDLSESGKAMLATIGKGISNAASGLKDQVSVVLSDIRNLLPFSDAKEGPFSNLTASGQAIMTTMASGVKQGQPVLKKGMEDAFNAVAETLVSLEKQSNTIGFTIEQLEIYELRQQGATQAVLEHAQVLQSDIATKNALFEAEQRLKAVQLTPEQLEAQYLQSQGISEANIQQIQSVNALADAEELLFATESKLQSIGKTPEQLELEALAQQGVNQAILDQIEANQIAIVVSEKRQKLQEQLAYIGMTAYEKELEALRRKGASEKEINSIVELRTQIEQEKNNTVLNNLDKELAFLQMSRDEQEQYNVLKKFGHKYATEAQKQELLEKHELIEAQKEQNELWLDVTNTAGDYFESILNGSMNAKDAFHAFADDMKSTWSKSLASMATQQLQNFDFGKLFSGNGGGAGGDMMSAISGMFSSNGGGAGGGIMSTITNMFSGSGGVGTSATGLSQSLGGLGKTITGLMPQSEGLTGSLGAMGGPVGMGALSAGMSLLEGDKQGAIVGLAQLAGSMTPLGPLGGMAAGALAQMSGLGAEWVREAEWIVADFKGMTAEFSKGFREVKKGFITGGSQIGYEDLPEKELAQLNEQFKAIKGTLETVNASLGDLDINLMAGMTDFVAHLEDREGLGAEVFAENMQEVQRQMISHAIDNMMIMGVDDDATKELSENVSQIVSGRVSDLMALFTDVNGKIDFDLAVADSTWNGDLDRILGQFEVNSEHYHQMLTEGLNDFISSMDLGDMGADEIQAQLAEKTAAMFHQIGVTDIPQSTFDELSQLLAGRINEAILFVEQGISKFAVTEDIEFFKTLKAMSREFDGSAKELQKFIADMTSLKTATKNASLNTDILTKEFINMSGGAEKASQKIAFFGDKFISDTQRQSAQLKPALNTISNTITDLGKGVPKTRDEFAQLVQSMNNTGPESAKLTQSLLEAAPAFDTYYSTLEQFTGQATQSFDQIGVVFNDLGLAVPNTRQGFTDLINSLDVTTESGRQLMESLVGMAPAVDNLFTAMENVFSIDAASLGQNLMDAIFNASSAEEAGQMMADRFAEQFYQQMIGSVMNSVAQTIFEGMVSPFLNSSAQAALNITQGGAIAGTTLNEGAAISATTMSEGGAIAATTLSEGSVISATNLAEGGTIAGTNVGTGGEIASGGLIVGGTIAAEALAALVEQVKQQMEIMAEVMTQLKEEGVMEEIQNAMMDVGSAAFETVQATPAAQFQKTTLSTPETKTISSSSSPIKAISTATDSMSESFKKATPTISSTAKETDNLTTQRQEEADAIAEQQVKAADFNTDIRQQIIEFGLEGMDLDLFQLDKEFEKTKQEAIELGANLTNVEKLYGLKRQEIIEDYREQEIEAITGFQTEMAKLTSGLSDSEFQLSQLANKYPALTQAINDSGMSYEQIVKTVANMSETELQALANAHGVSVTEFVEDAGLAIGAMGDVADSFEETQ
ncbi:MAG: phage tail tape measure protein, partial [Candidatus Parabeggiatoa sp. nov. 3]